MIDRLLRPEELLSALLWASVSATLAAGAFALVERRWGGGMPGRVAYLAIGLRLLLPLPAPWGALPESPWWTWAVGLWLAGTAWMVAGLLVKSLATYRMAVAGEVATPEAVSADFVAARKRVGLAARPALICGEGSLPPLVIGLLRPLVVIPRASAREHPERLPHILCHELTHLKRGDLFMNTFWQLAASLHWFNPFAKAMLRRQRFHTEVECDEHACRALGDDSGRLAYAQTLLDMAEPAQAVEGAACMAESDHGLGARVDRLLTPPRRNGAAAAATFAMLAVLAFLPLVGWRTGTAGEAEAKATPAAPVPADAPSIVRMDPPNNTPDVDPNTPMLILHFSQPMGGGIAWAQRGEEFFPKIDKQAGELRWLNNRTAVLPVRLEPDKDYEILLNVPPFVGFRSRKGVPAPAVIYRFHTGKQAENAETREALRKKQLADLPADPSKSPMAPYVVARNPENEADDVDPNTPMLIVRFDQPMKGGFSWVQVDSDRFPKNDEAHKTRWLDDKTAVMPVRLEPGKEYEVWLNTPPYTNFRSVAGGLPANATSYIFRTGNQAANPERREQLRKEQTQWVKDGKR